MPSAEPRPDALPRIELGIETDWRMPAGGDTAGVADELKHHIQVVER